LAFFASFAPPPPNNGGIWGTGHPEKAISDESEKVDDELFCVMAPMLPASFTRSLNPLLVLGLSAGALLGAVALIPGRAVAVPIGPLDKSNNESVPHRSYQESRIGVDTSNKYKPCALNRSNQNTSYTNTELSERVMPTALTN
jgi:hypothetical protein